MAGTALGPLLLGVQSSLTMAGTALGPLLLGLGHDYWGAYEPVLLRLAVLPAMLSVLVFCFLKKPVHPVDQRQSSDDAKSIYGASP